MNTFNEIMERDFYPRLQHRESSFRKIFDYLESLNKDKYVLIETGTTRLKDNIEGDGNATLMFDLYCNTIRNGIVYTVDIDPNACANSRQWTSNKTIVCLSDSVKFLSAFSNPDEIDLLYLDSFDLHWENPHPSSLHHLKELTAIYAKLKPGCLIVVDDNHNGIGKGQYVSEFLENTNNKLYFNEYQIAYIKL